MNFPLYKQMMKSNIKLFLGFGLVSAIYVVLMTSLFPLFADNLDEMESMMELFPDSLLRAFGLEAFGNYGQFISAEYYGLFYLLILGVFSVMSAVQLLAKLVDRGSMAYLLSTRISRFQITFTQMMVLLSGLIIIHVLNFGGGLAAGELLIDEQNAIAMKDFFQINFVGFLLFFAVGGYSFLVSSLLNDERSALATAGGVTFLFYGMNMIGKIVTDVDWLRNITPFSLYEPGKIAGGDAEVWTSSLILTGIGILAYTLAILLFRHRNLPL
ncbi:ABC transporter permease subunit [Salimicrobium jeotgali]|uniref:ABC transporter permease subunit n=1 Tax=Salimicrobium jeotgali TaxID=1230341 RepID=UPI000C82743C|nr:ABC transporter permease subunit [Salimicrobium jeotgali]